MAGWRQTIQKMVDGYDSQVISISSQISSLQNKAYDLQDQVSAVNEVSRITESGLTGYLSVNKRNSIAGKLGIVPVTNIQVKFGQGYGAVSLTNWYMLWNGKNDGEDDEDGKVVYSYRKAGWDGDSLIICLLQEFGFLKDYVNVNLNIGLYGLDSLLNLLNSAIGKLEDMISAYETAKRRFESILTTGASGCFLSPFFK